MISLCSLSKVGGDQHIGGHRGQNVEGDRSPSVPMVVVPMGFGKHQAIRTLMACVQSFLDTHVRKAVSQIVIFELQSANYILVVHATHCS